MIAAAILAVMGSVIAAGLLLIDAILKRRLDDPTEALIASIDALLPQTQCAQCGYPGCRPYARAIAAGAPIDLCPPGGQAAVEDLGALLGRASTQRLDEPVAQLARIRINECIGCVKCVDVCPVDAIVGAPQLLHAVIDEHCTGCELCIPACPVDCIDLVAIDEPSHHRV